MCECVCVNALANCFKNRPSLRPISWILTEQQWILFTTQLSTWLFVFLLGDTLFTFPQGHFSPRPVGPTSEPHEESIQPVFMAYRNISFPLQFLLGLSFLDLRLHRAAGQKNNWFQCVIISSWGKKGKKSCTLTYGVNQRRNRKQCCFVWGMVTCCYLTFSTVEQDEKSISTFHRISQPSLMGELYCPWQCLHKAQMR